MELNSENYYSEFANASYMSVSQYKEYAGTYGRPGCEAAAMAKLRGEYSEAPSQAMLVGSYVDAYFEGTLDEFRATHPDLFTQRGELKAAYKKADDMINRAEKDPLFKKYMSGEKQVIMTGELFGVDWKIKMDSYLPGKAIVDLKCMSSLSKLCYSHEVGYIDFVRFWGYDIQGAVYQQIVYQNTGERLPFFIAGISKEDAIDLEIIGINDFYLDEALEGMRDNMERIKALRSGADIEPRRCECCAFCRETKILKKPIGLSELLER